MLFRSLAAPLNGNGTVPSTEINALADILAACVNSTSGSSQCSTLFTDAPNGSSTAPTDSATAAINIAHNPTANVTALLNTVNTGAPFQPVISSATSFTLAVNFTGGGLSQPSAVAVDASGNIWVSNQATPGGVQATGRVSKLNHLGVPANSTGYTGGGLILGQNVAVDNSGNVWVGSTTLTASTNNLSEFNGTTGAAISGASGFTGGGLNNPIGLAIDQSGNVWTANDGTFVTLPFVSWDPRERRVDRGGTVTLHGSSSRTVRDRSALDTKLHHSPHPRPSRPRPQPARAVAETAASLSPPGASFPPTNKKAGAGPEGPAPAGTAAPCGAGGEPS